MISSLSGIYAIRLKLDGRAYIGSAINPRKRWYRHKYILKKRRHHSPYLQNAWNKYGEQSFEFVILEECAPQALIERERYYFSTYANKFNCAPVAGSSLGRKATEETKNRMRLSMRRPIRHGTMCGYQTELDRGMKPCRPCNEARRKCMESYRRGKGALKMGTPEHSKMCSLRTSRPIRHGTIGGCRREYSLGLRPCDACRLASNKYQLNRKRKNGVLKSGSPEHRIKIGLRMAKPIAHGTHAGYQQERRRGLIPCAVCKEACRVANLEYKKHANQRKSKQS